MDIKNKTNSSSPLGAGGSFIILENMEFHAYHGCLEHEQTLGNTFIVSLSLGLDTELAGRTDDLEHTLNYQLVYDVVKREIEIPSKLLEHLGQRILDCVYNEFPQILEIGVRLSKLNPPLGGKVNRVTIELERKR